jgi:hypothetical protein
MTIPMKTVAMACVLFVLSWAALATADVAPEQVERDPCSQVLVQQPGERCLECPGGIYYGSRCADDLAPLGLSERCRTQGETTWSEVWCYPPVSGENRPLDRVSSELMDMLLSSANQGVILLRLVMNQPDTLAELVQIVGSILPVDPQGEPGWACNGSQIVVQTNAADSSMPFISPPEAVTYTWPYSAFFSHTLIVEVQLACDPATQRPTGDLQQFTVFQNYRWDLASPILRQVLGEPEIIQVGDISVERYGNMYVNTYDSPLGNPTMVSWYRETPAWAGGQTGTP